MAATKQTFKDKPPAERDLWIGYLYLAWGTHKNIKGNCNKNRKVTEFKLPPTLKVYLTEIRNETKINRFKHYAFVSIIQINLVSVMLKLQT